MHRIHEVHNGGYRKGKIQFMIIISESNQLIHKKIKNWEKDPVTSKNQVKGIIPGLNSG